MNELLPVGVATALVPVGSAAPKLAGKIDKDGVYQLSLDTYHGDCAVGPSVSSSGLRTIENQSLAHYWVDSSLNPERVGFEPSKAMTLGSAAHWLLLGEAGFGERFVLRPDEAPDGRAWNANNLSCRKWIAEQALAGKMVLTNDMLDHVKGMAASLAKHPMVRAGLFSGEAEQSLIWRDEETGLWLKSRPDVLPKAGEVRVDLKTTTDASERACARTMADYGLHMQAALVCEAQEKLFGWDRRDTDCWLCFVETSPPYAVAVRLIDENAIHWGRALNRRALRKLATAIEKNEFPGYEDDHATLSLPKWTMDNYEQQKKLSLLHEVN